MPSEFSFIKRIRERIRSSSADLIKGIGDDAAVWSEVNGRERLISTDLLIEKVHFDLEYTQFKCLGYKTLAVSLSDIAAMGGKPDYALLSVGIPKKIKDNDDWDNFFESYLSLAEKYQVTLIGGDTSASPDNLVIDSIVIGSCPIGKSVKRSGAKVGDRLYITGKIGASTTGLCLLQNGERWNDAVDDEIQRSIKAHLMPEPRVEIGWRMGGFISSMIDVSDGLAQDLYHICVESNVSAIVDFDSVPISPLIKLIGTDPDEMFKLAMSGGEDYELMFSADADKEKELLKLARECDINITRIGEMVEHQVKSDKPKLFVRKKGVLSELNICGYDHFR